MPDRAILPQLNQEVLGILQSYRDTMSHPETISESLIGLSRILRTRFSQLADLDSHLGYEDAEVIDNFQLQLFLAGFDTDGEARIGSLNLTVKRQRWADGHLHWTSEELDGTRIEPVGGALLVRSGGLDKIEKAMLSHPENFPSAIMKEYVRAMQKDNGASLPLEFLEKRGQLFKSQTQKVEKAVGGSDQVATIVKGNPPKFVGLASFPSIKPPIPFSEIDCLAAVTLSGTGMIRTGHHPAIFQSCTFDGVTVEVRYNVFLQCTFLNANLIFDGGDAVFDEDNEIKGTSVLSLGLHSARRPDLAKQLASRFDFLHGGTAVPNPNGVNPAAKPSNLE
jgi:hypothetical protein